jgi:hypothetical protein
MDTNHIRDAVRQQPFRPFTMRMNDGREFHVTHPECLAVSTRLVILIDPATEAILWFEPMLIASLHFGSPSPKTPSDADS